MAKRHLYCFGIVFFFSLTAVTQPVVYINAGSRASYGNHQELTIDINGACRYYLREVNGRAKDSSFFSISKESLIGFLSFSEQSGFFSLKEKYESGAVDGSGIYISLNVSGKKHSVHLINTDEPVINRLTGKLNEILAAFQIRIYYGQPLSQ
jgi:hypothetical protein